MTDKDDEPEHKVPCKQCTRLSNHVCGLCQKAKAKCKKSSRRGGKGGGDNKDKGKALGKWFLDPCRHRLINQ